MRQLKRLLFVLMLGTLLLSIPATFAQEEAAAETSPAVPGITAGVMLLGLGAIILVGGAIIIRDSFNPEEEAE